MPKAIEELIKRGYWDKAGDGTDGGSSGGSGDDSGSGDDGDDAGDTSDGDTSDNDKGKGKGGAEGDDNSPSAETKKLLLEVMKKKEAIKTLTNQLGEVNTALKAWEGLDPEEVRNLVKQKKDAETKALEAKGEWDKLKAQMNEENQKVLNAKDARIAELEEKLGLNGSLIEKLTVGHAFDNSKFIAEELILTPRKARTVYGSYFENENGQIVGYDKPRGDSGRVQLVDGKGDPLSFEAALKKLVDSDPDRDTLIRSKAKPGAGSRTETDAPPANSGTAKSGLERIRAGLTGGVGK